MFSEKINFDADDPIFLTGLMAGTMLATLIDDWTLTAVIAGISVAVVYVTENESIVKFIYGFMVAFIISSLAKLMKATFLPKGLSLSIPPATL